MPATQYSAVRRSTAECGVQMYTLGAQYHAELRSYSRAVLRALVVVVG